MRYKVTERAYSVNHVRDPRGFRLHCLAVACVPLVLLGAMVLFILWEESRFADTVRDRPAGSQAGVWLLATLAGSVVLAGLAGVTATIVWHWRKRRGLVSLPRPRPLAWVTRGEESGVADSVPCGRRVRLRSGESALALAVLAIPFTVIGVVVGFVVSQGLFEPGQPLGDRLILAALSFAFCAPFLGFGLLGCRQVLTLLLVRPRLHAGNDTVRLGEEAELDCGIDGMVGGLRDIRLTLEGREVFVGPKRVRHEPFFVLPILQMDQFQGQGRALTARIPADTMHSVLGEKRLGGDQRRNGVAWSVRLQVRPPYLARIDRHYPITVLPRRPDAPARRPSNTADTPDRTRFTGTLGIAIAGNRTHFRPGEWMRGTAMWRLDRAPVELSVRLLWWLGQFPTDVSLVAIEDILAPAASGEARFEFELPDGPYSYRSTQGGLQWGVELVARPGRMHARTLFNISPTGRPVDLRSRADSGTNPPTVTGKPGEPNA